MQCSECKEELLDLAYEAVRPQRRLQLLDHVDRCPLCHEEYTDLLQSRSVLQEWPDESPSWGLRIDPERAAPGRTWLGALPAWLRLPLPAFRLAGLAFLIALSVLAATHSRVEWRNGGLTIQAQLWSSGAGSSGGSVEASRQEELLKAVDQIIAESERRQNQLFGTAMIKMYEDLEVRRRYEEGEMQTAFDRLQQQTETRWERVGQSRNQ